MMDQHLYPVEQIIKEFEIKGNGFVCQPYGSGHINDTYLVRNGNASYPDYLLQRINHQVFRDVETLMDNVWQVTTHIKQKITSLKNQKVNFDTITLIPVRHGDAPHGDAPHGDAPHGDAPHGDVRHGDVRHGDAPHGKLYYQDAEGLYWRMQTFIPHSISYDVVRSEAQAFQAGKAFGKFQALLYDLPVEKLRETIPDFHNMDSRMEKFSQVLEADVAERKSLVEKEINFAFERKQEMLAMYAHVKNGDLPLRITHNDTKFNNVLLDEKSQEAVCVIDLDTVMPGVVHFDFGDAVRTIANTAVEDEKHLGKIEVNLQFYEAFARGYLQEAGSFLTTTEITYLAFSARYMTFIMGLRFLTDYIAGDVYYKTQHKEHNLQRARAQFKLLSGMEKLYPTMEAIIHQLTEKKPA